LKEEADDEISKEKSVTDDLNNHEVIVIDDDDTDDDIIEDIIKDAQPVSDEGEVIHTGVESPEPVEDLIDSYLGASEIDTEVKIPESESEIEEPEAGIDQGPQ
jgi:glycosyltransferase involved in cell wall biosynthesis